MNRRIAHLLVVPVALLLAAADTRARSVTLDDWVEAVLLPGVERTLSQQPRFKGQTIRFVVFEDGAPAAASNALAISIRDRLVDTAIARGGIRVASSTNSAAPGQRIDCAQSDADYLFGIEMTPNSGRTATVVVRAMDIHENTWVGGLNIRWRGDLTRNEQRAMQSPLADAELRGARGAPFEAHQTDLLAEHLARKMACQLLGTSSADYVLSMAARTGGEQDALWTKTLDIASRHVAALGAIEFSAGDARGTATLDGTAHEIGDGLYQYWLTVEPRDTGLALETLSVSAYVRRGTARPGESVAHASSPRVSHTNTSHTPQVIPVPGAFGNDALGPLRVAQNTQGRVLQTAVRSDVIVFFLQFEPGLGLMRLGDRDCRSRTIARVARSGDSLAFPITDRGSSENVGEISRWQVDPIHNTYFAIAIRDSGLARHMATHVDLLPMRCGTTTPLGLQDQALRRWLDEFIDLVDDRPRQVAWRAIQTREVL